MTCPSKCFYREDRIPGEGRCFLVLPGPEATCTSHKAPAKVNPAPLDPEWAKKFERMKLCQ